MDQGQRSIFSAAVVFLGAVFGTSVIEGRVEAMMVTTNVIQRTFHIKWQGGTGTGFVIDYGSREYLVTARHVVEGIESGKVIEVFQGDEWKTLVVRSRRNR